MLKINETYKLSASNIDVISEKTSNVCRSLKLPSDQRIRVCFLVEEVLGEWLRRNNGNADIDFEAETLFFKPVILLSFSSPEPCNPLKSDGYDGFLKTAFERLSYVPDFSYERGKNIISIRLKKPELNPIVKIFLIMFFSLIFGFLGQLLLPQPVIVKCQKYIVAPTYEKFLDILGCIAGPLIFFSVAWGIYGMGDTATLNKLGKGMIISFLRDVILSVLVCVVFFPVFGCVVSGGQVDFSQVLSVYNMFLDMIPETIVEPFAAGNIFQIIVLAVIVGIALLCLGRKTRYVAVAIEQISLLTNFLMEAISKIVPFFIVMVLINMVWSGTLDVLVNSWMFIAVLIVALFLIAMVHLVITSLHNKVKISVLFRKTLPSFLIALTTASSAASFGTLVKNCEQKFGISESLTSFGIPLGIVMHKVATATNCILISFYVAGISQIECSLGWIIMAVIISVITAVATPPIPGGAVIGYSMLFSQLGIPEEGLVISLAIDVITDFFVTSTDIFCLPMALTGLARKFDLLNVEKLRKINS